MSNTIKTPLVSFFKDGLALMAGLSEPEKSGGPRPPDFGRSVDSIQLGGQIKRSDYIHHITYHLLSWIFRPSSGPKMRT